MNASYDDLIIACPRCLNKILANEKKCGFCDLILSDKERLLLGIASRNVFYWGWQYGGAFYKEYRDTGKIESRYIIEPNAGLSYLASLIISGIIGGLSYDLVKTYAQKILSHLCSNNSNENVLFLDKNSQKNLETIFELTKAYVEHDSKPLSNNDRFSEVFKVIEFHEPGEFLDLSLIVELKRIYEKYSDKKNIGISYVQTASTSNMPIYRDIILRYNFLDFVFALTHSSIENKNKIIKLFADGHYGQAIEIIRQTNENRDIIEMSKLGSQELTGLLGKWQRDAGMILELIENSVMAVHNISHPQISIYIDGNRFFIEDNGPGMSQSTVFGKLFVPGETGWTELGIWDKNGIYEHAGYGFTGGLMWCNRVVLETKAIDHRSLSFEILVKDLTNMDLIISEIVDKPMQNCGTRVYGEICQHARPYWELDSPGYGCFANFTEAEVAQYLIDLIHKYCIMVDERIPIYLNGLLVNEPERGGIGPRGTKQCILSVESFSDYVKGFTINDKIEVSVYLGVMSSNKYLHTEDSDSPWYYNFKCVIEFYQNGFFICKDFLESVLEFKNYQLSVYQKKHLHHKIIRIFLPEYVIISIGKTVLNDEVKWNIIKILINLFDQ